MWNIINLHSGYLITTLMPAKSPKNFQHTHFFESQRLLQHASSIQVHDGENNSIQKPKEGKMLFGSDDLCFAFRIYHTSYRKVLHAFNLSSRRENEDSWREKFNHEGEKGLQSLKHRAVDARARTLSASMQSKSSVFPEKWPPLKFMTSSWSLRADLSEERSTRMFIWVPVSKFLDFTPTLWSLWKKSLDNCRQIYGRFSWIGRW